VRYASRQQYLSAQVAKVEAARLAARQETKAVAVAPAKVEAKAAPVVEVRPAAPRRKLSFKEQKELDELPKRIDALEAEQITITAKLADPATWKSAGSDATALNRRLSALPGEIEGLWARWTELSER
jgi:ATP-binding cassette subfamily F protein uup